jgi:uncharacterized protein (DUF1501 family)
MHDCGCQDYTRTELLRRAASGAAVGVREFDPRMPVPAGTGLDRRSFLLRSLGVAISVYGAGRLGWGAFEEGIAKAAAGPAQPILVSIFLPGGIDSLSVLAPTGEPEYKKLRPTLALGDSDGTAFTEDSRLRWHPSAGSLATLHSEGKLTVLPAIGYDHPDQSHFNSRHFWEVGALDRELRTGWMGRYLDRVGAADNPLQGLTFDGRLAPALAAAHAPIATVNGRGTYDFVAPNVWGPVEDFMYEAIGSLASTHAQSSDPALKQAGAAQLQASTLRSELAPFDVSKITSPVEYPKEGGSFPEGLAALAAMIAAGMPLRCVSITAFGSYDTHASQPDQLAEGLKAVSDGLLAFQHDLEARGIADRVLVQVWSEFGRRGEENASAGTDHGAGGVGFLLGSRVRGTMIGEFPGLGNLDEDGNLRATSDFRALYCSLLEQWFSTDAAAVIPEAGRFPRVSLFK